MKEGDKCLVEFKVIGSPGPGYIRLADPTKEEIDIPEEYVMPMPEYTNGEEVDIRTTEHGDPIIRKYAAFVDGKHYYYHPDFPDEDCLQVTDYIRKPPQTVMVEIDRDKHRQIMDIAKSADWKSGEQVIDLFKAIVDGAEVAE